MDPNSTTLTSRRWRRRVRASFKRLATVAHGRRAMTYGRRNFRYVICVGGTDLVTKSAGGPGLGNRLGRRRRRISRTNSDSVLAAAPRVITKANEGSTNYRNGPDVSANANFTFYVCADQLLAPDQRTYGGTSFAAPMWAGYMALANQQAAANGDPAARLH